MNKSKDSEEIVTSDLSKFGFVELREAAKLLTRYVEDGADYLGDGVTVMFNRNSGNVFITDEDYNVGMLTSDGKLEQWFNCPICGEEGFFDDILTHAGDVECAEWLNDLKASRKERNADGREAAAQTEENP